MLSLLHLPTIKTHGKEPLIDYSQSHVVLVIPTPPHEKTQNQHKDQWKGGGGCSNVLETQKDQMF